MIIDVNSSTMTVGVRGSAANNNLKMGMDSDNNAYIEMNGNTYGDVMVDGNAATYIISLGDGNDSFTANPTTSLSVTHLSESVTSVTAVTGENHAVSEYEKALEKDLSAGFLEVVCRQHAAVVAARDEVKALHEAA